MGSLDYQIPAHSGTVFGRLSRALTDGEPARIVDLCCSYGVNATVLRHEVSFDEVLSHYRSPSIESLASDELCALDREWFAARRSDDPPRICGIDSSTRAIAYAVDAGLIDSGFTEDLEADDPSPELIDELHDADLVTVSGGIGYITERTIDRVFAHSRAPRLAALSLRWVDFAPVVDIGAEHGLVTERLDEATFPQRRFASDEERDEVESALERFNVDPEGREADGYHHTDLYLLRPEHEVRARPLEELLDPIEAIGPGGVPVPQDHEPQVSLFSSGNELRQR